MAQDREIEPATKVPFSDVPAALSWIEKLNLTDLRDWFRIVFWLRDPLPINVPSQSRLALEVAEVLKRGSSGLKTRVRIVVPSLFQEWGRDDPSDVLDDLLIVSAKLRCASAEPMITLIATERLRGRIDEVPLRQRCLSVVSGFGCTERSVFLFKGYMEDVDYAAISFRALYRFDPIFAAVELPRLCRVFQKADAISEMNIALQVLFRDLKKPVRIFEVLNLLVAKATSSGFEYVLQRLKGSGLLTSDLFLEANEDQRAEFFRLLLARGSVEGLREMLLDFKLIGIELHLVESSDGKEYLHAVYQTAIESINEQLFSTERFSYRLLLEIIEATERVALVWAEAPEGVALN